MVAFECGVVEMFVAETGVSDLEEEEEDFMQQILWAKGMELRKAETSLGDEIGWMVASSQQEASLALFLEIVES